MVTPTPFIPTEVACSQLRRTKPILLLFGILGEKQDGLIKSINISDSGYYYIVLRLLLFITGYFRFQDIENK